jgi:hypothetical protein
MRKKKFHSRLFARNIEKSEKDYEAIVKAELLFRIKDFETKNRSCMACRDELQELKDYYQKLTPTEKCITDLKIY